MERREDVVADPEIESKCTSHAPIVLHKAAGLPGPIAGRNKVVAAATARCQTLQKIALGDARIYTRKIERSLWVAALIGHELPADQARTKPDVVGRACPRQDAA